MPRAYGYCRLSKDETTIVCKRCKNEWVMKIESLEQTDFDCPFCDHTFHMDRNSPLSIQAQTDACVKLAMERLPRSIDPNLEILADINISGGIPIRDRPKGGELFQKIQRGDYLIVPKLDRGWRNMEDFCRQINFFLRVGIKLIIGNIPDMDIHTPVGKVILQVLAAFSEFEREQISERTKAGLAKKKALGEPTGWATPRGFDLFCTECNHKYSFVETRKGQACPACKIPRNKHTCLKPNRNEHAIMWRLLWERSGYCWKDWNMVVHGLREDGYTTRENRKITVKFARNYYDSACELLAMGELLLECRPSKMENFSIKKLINIPKHVQEMLDKKQRGDAA